MQKKIIVSLGIIVLLILAFYLFTAFNNKKEITVSPYLNSNIEIKTFQVSGAWGYDVLIDGALYVHQPNIPAVAGDKGFQNQVDAQKTAELVVEKIRKNIMPPSVSPEELKGLGIGE